MKLKEGTFYAILFTTGRKSGKEHAVELKAVFHNDKFYFSRRNSNSDWLRNAMTNPLVKVKFDGEIFLGTATLVSDEELVRKISQMKYSDKRAQESRIVLEVMPYE